MTTPTIPQTGRNSAGQPVTTLSDLAGVFQPYAKSADVLLASGGSVSPHTAVSLSGSVARSMSARFSDFANARDAGAKGVNDSTDDGPAINAWIAACASSASGLTDLRLPAGIYRTSVPINFAPLRTSGMPWVFDARGAMIIATAAMLCVIDLGSLPTSTPIQIFKASVLLGEIDGAGLATYAVRLRYFNDSEFTARIISGAVSHGVYVDQTAGATASLGTFNNLWRIGAIVLCGGDGFAVDDNSGTMFCFQSNRAEIGHLYQNGGNGLRIGRTTDAGAFNNTFQIGVSEHNGGYGALDNNGGNLFDFCNTNSNGSGSFYLRDGAQVSATRFAPNGCADPAADSGPSLIVQSEPNAAAIAAPLGGIGYTIENTSRAAVVTKSIEAQAVGSSTGGVRGLVGSLRFTPLDVDWIGSFASILVRSYAVMHEVIRAVAATGASRFVRIGATDTTASPSIVGMDTSGATTNLSLGGTVLATNATTGFPMVPVCAGTPTGTPQSPNGGAPVIVDSSGTRLWVYVGGAWRYAVLT